jgi:cobalt-zinc-cadmium efflux system membrane fusion protein
MKYQICLNGMAWKAALLAAAVTHAAPAVLESDAHAGQDHGAHAGHDEDVIRLTAEQRQRFGVKVRQAAAGSLRSEVRLPGEIVFNEDRLVHLTPRVAGVAREVHKTVGDRVRTGEAMAVIDSRELADAKAEHLAARARAALAEKVFEREQALHAQKVSSQQDLLDAEQALAEARIVLRSSAQKLRALGLDGAAVAALDERLDADITRFEIRSPIDGVVAARHVSLGESLAADADIFTIVDISSVWVNLAVHVRNLAAVRAGQEVLLRIDHDGAQTKGTIAMVTPFVAEGSRSATARVVVDNADGRWIPGTFVTGLIGVAEDSLPVVVPLSAVQKIEGRDVVFVEQGGGFEMAPVTLGRRDRAAVEVTSGLAAGTSYVAEGAFQLKATVVTSALDAHAGHGH